MDRRPQYHEAQRTKRLADFYDGTMAVFVTTFPESFVGLGGHVRNSEGDNKLSAANLKSGKEVRVLPFINSQRELINAKKKYSASNPMVSKPRK